MKFPRDPKYSKISFYVIFTLVVFYVFKVIIDGIALGFQSMGKVSVGFNGFFSKLFSALAPLFIALIIAYLMEPLVVFFQKEYDLFFNEVLEPYLERFRFYQKRKQKKTKQSADEKGGFKKRAAGAAISYLAIILLIGFFIFILVSRIDHEGNSSFSDSLAQTITSTVNDFSDLYIRFQVRLEEWGVLVYLSQYLSQLLKTLSDLVEKIAFGFIGFAASAGSRFAQFGIGLIVAFYFMSEKEFIQAKTSEMMDIFIPRKPNRILRNLFGDLDVIFSGYIRGQLTDAFIMAVLMSIWLSIVGVRFAVIIGVFSGFSNIIPYFGALIGFGLSILAAFLSGEPVMAIYAGAGIIVLQIIDSMLLAPKVMGRYVELSPVLVILSLTIAGSLFGVVGMILAVPMCAIIKQLLSRFVERYRNGMNDGN